MPGLGAGASNGLKLSDRLFSGEDSITSSDWLELLPPELALLGVEDDPPEEQAARPAAAKSATAPAASVLLLENLLTVNLTFPLVCCDFEKELSVSLLDGAVRH
jgi:hypothetical protein